MKYVLALILLMIGISCRQDNKARVVDHAHLLSPEQIYRLDSLFAAHERKTSNEIALLISADASDSATIPHATVIANQMGIGKKEKNNGVFILLNTQSHEVAIVTGLGTQKVLPDAVVSSIIHTQMIPCFRENDLFKGIWTGCTFITAYLEQPEHQIH